MSIFFFKGRQKLIELIIIRMYVPGGSRLLWIPGWSFEIPIEVDLVEFIDTLLRQRRILLYHNPLIPFLHCRAHLINKCRKLGILPLWNVKCFLFFVVLFELFKFCIPLMFIYVPYESYIVQCGDTMLFDVFGVTVEEILVKDSLILDPGVNYISRGV